MNDFMTKVASQSMNRIALFSLVAAAIYFFTIYDSGAAIEQQIATLKAEVDVETSKKSETEKILKKEEQMRADVALLAKTYEEVKAKIPIEFDASEMRLIVEQISNSVGIKISKLTNTQDNRTLGPAFQQSLVEQVVMDYELQGHYNQILNFITELSKVEKILKVEDFKVEPIRTGNSPSTALKITTKVIGYKQVQPSKASDKVGG